MYVIPSTIIKNFNFKARAVNFTEVDARLGLNNLQTPFASNEIKYSKEEIENITNKLEKDEILYKLGNINIYNEIDTINYKLSEKDNFESNINTNFLEDKTELDNYYDVEDIETLELNNSNTFEISEQLEITDNCITFKKDLSNAKKVKEILINNWIGGSNCGGIFRFYDENENLIESGDIISSSSTYGETENFIIECNSTYANAERYFPISGVRTDLDKGCIPSQNYMYVANSVTPSEYLKITFKNPQYIFKILSNPYSEYPGSYTQANYCEINLIFENDTKLNIPIQVSNHNEIAESNNLYQIYNVEDIQYFCTTINKFENFDINSFSSFSLFGKNLDTDSIEFKIALSFDENNYFVFKDGNWNSINKDRTEIFNNGMTLEEFTSITKNDIKDYFGEVQKCDLYFSFLNKKAFTDTPKFNKIYKIFKTRSKEDILLTNQILINNFTSSHLIGCIFRFYDENENLIESGEILNYTQEGTYAESENFIMESYSCYNNAKMFGIMNAFRTDLEKSVIPTTANFFVCHLGESQYANIKFKVPQKISKIEFNLSPVFSQHHAQAKSCTMNLMFNEIIIESFDLESDNINNSIQILTSFNSSLSYYNDSTGVIKTNTNQLQNINKIEKIKIVANELENTKVRIALSTDSKSTYLKFNGTNWDTIQENDIINNGNTIDEINDLTYLELSILDLTNKTLDFIVCMETSDVTVTPSIKKIIVTSMNRE